MECSNAGHCDRGLGACQCFEGFEGAACQRASCPNQCSGRGTCLTLYDLGRFEGPDYAHPGKGGDGIGPLYSNWDRDSISACNCHPGYFGPDCSLAMCPKGDDPLTAEVDITQASTTSLQLDHKLKGDPPSERVA